MTVSTIATIAASLSRVQGNQNTKPASVLGSLFAANTQSNKADSADVTTAISLQNQIAQFRVASQNVAQANSVLGAAGAGGDAIARELGKLQALAAKAASFPLSNAERVQINAEFQAIRNKIASIATSTTFNNESLLDGESPQLKIASENAQIKKLAIQSLTDSALFKGANPNLLTAESSKQAEAAIKEAQAYVNQQLENIKSLQGGLDYASSTLQTAIQNQDAANSSLNDADFTTQLFGGNNGAQSGDLNSLLAQTSRLPSSLLLLLKE